ncbi:AraC family transcriptional regulator [Actinoallomurus liliacearum]|uniref:AraC family transcriptional regulator n=1 Tax=Actinoallomurus liliacearum TaxID=1080073 RepID=A0ABP8TGN6_9ACTN
MDVLSDAITAMRTGRAHSARTERRSPWAVRHPSFAGAGFHVVLQGICRLVADGSPPIVLGAGDVVFLPHGTAHEMADPFSEPPAAPRLTPLVGLHDQTSPDRPGASTVTLCGAYLLDRARPHPLINELPEVVHLPARVGHDPSLRAAIDLLGAELKTRRPGADVNIPALLDTLLVQMLRGWLDQQSASGTAVGWAAALHDPAIVAALSGIHSDPARPWTVEDLSARAGLSRAAFARRFSELVGRPPLRYLTWWRLTTAARLLRDSDAPLATVAHHVGYTSEFAFANAFKREYGLAPGRYRAGPQPRARRDTRRTSTPDTHTGH